MTTVPVYRGRKHHQTKEAQGSKRNIKTQYGGYVGAKGVTHLFKECKNESAEVPREMKEMKGAKKDV